MVVVEVAVGSRPFFPQHSFAKPPPTIGYGQAQGGGYNGAGAGGYGGECVREMSLDN